MANVTIKDVARVCNVSPSTVSNVLNGKPKVSNEKKKQILEAMESIGYQPNIIAQGLRRQKTKTIGIIVEDITQFTTPEIIEGVMSTCEEMGYKTVVKNLRLYARWDVAWFDNTKMVDSVVAPAMQELKNLMVDGIIYIAGHGRKFQFPESCSLPLALCYAYAVDGGVPSVVLDDETSAYNLGKYLTALGHTNIGIVAGEKDNVHTQLRMLGFQKAFYEAGILYNPDAVHYAGWNRHVGYDCARDMVKKGMTAIVAMNDRIAGGVYQYCYDNGIRIGEDISVVGFDNEILAEHYCPPLTTMGLPLEELGKKTAQELFLAMEESDDRKEKKVIKLVAELIERDSVKALK